LIVKEESSPGVEQRKEAKSTTLPRTCDVDKHCSWNF